jgi:hypothetical protein
VEEHLSFEDFRLDKWIATLVMATKEDGEEVSEQEYDLSSEMLF